MNSRTQPVYDCDTSEYWCSEEDYHRDDKTYGSFIEDGHAYRVEDPETPRPWLNYFSNKRFGSVMSNRGLGFTWYRSTLLRVTKYEHPVDYLPREFQDGREIIIEDPEISRTVNVFREAEDLVCVHRPGYSTIKASIMDLEIEFTLFVPLDDPCEIWLVRIKNCASKKRQVTVRFQQTWSFSKFGIHTAEEGIPYISTPGKDLSVTADDKGVYCHSLNKELPYEMFGIFQCPQTEVADITAIEDPRPDGRHFTFHRCELGKKLELNATGEVEFEIVSGVEVTNDAFEHLKEKYLIANSARSEMEILTSGWGRIISGVYADIPDKNVQNFLNVWFKNQLNLVFNFVRSGQKGYRDTLQDAWGYVLIDPVKAEERLLEILSHQCADGTAPRQFSAFDDGNHDMRRFMDSSVWITRTLTDLVKETGDFSLLEKPVPFLDGESATVEEHVWRAMDYLYQNRGRYGICLTGDGDWNDALEGISRQGDAVSVWLTIALYDSMRLMVELYDASGVSDKSTTLRERMAELKTAVNENAWDGEWYIYGFTGSGKPIGSAENKEGRIHLNAQTWAVFSGIAGDERGRSVMEAVDEYLDTPLGPVLMDPPYVEEADEVGRIARLQPGTFENASIYQHAVSFKVFANIALGQNEKAFSTLRNLLPTNPDNFDCRRTSEPYCTGNYYCGPTHPRYGQNFFTWFTGNAAWLLRAGFDEILGVKAGFNGLEIKPR